jgi:hypothetical protein
MIDRAVEESNKGGLARRKWRPFPGGAFKDGR